MNFQVEHYRDIKGEVQSLAVQQHSEVGILPLDIDEEAYLYNRVVCVTGRAEGSLKAYAIYILRHHTHSKEMLTAYNDTVYMQPDMRGLDSFILLEHAERCLKTLGVKVIMYCVSEKLDWGKVLQVNGFQPIERVWMKEVA